MTLDYFYGQSGELFSYFRIPKALFQDHRFRQLSTDARTLYGILLDRMSLSVKNGWLDEQGRVYIIYTVREVQESLCCAEHKAVKLFRELEDIDLIERKRRGLGRPSLIYVKDFSSGLPKAQVQNCPNSNSGAAESAILVQPKPQANKTDKNKTEWNDPDPIYSGGIREQLEDYFYQALEVDLLLRLCPDDEDTIYQIVDLLVDTCSTKRKMLRIAGDDKPAEVVRSRLKKLNADHIRFVLDSLAENTAPVRNMKQYLLAMLYQTDKRKQDCYICGSYKKRTADCTAHFIRTDLLTAGVLDNLRKVTAYAQKHEARFMKLLIEQNEDGGKRRNAAKKKELEATEKRIAELSAIFKRLYEDSVTGRISDERFTELSADYEAEQRELKERAAAIQAELSKAQEATVNAEKFMNVVRRHTSFEELTPTLLREFVEKIVVHECSYDENKTRRQDIEIYYSFVGKVDLPE